MTQTKPREALGACLDEVWKYDHDRFLTVLLAPAGKRDALLALYAFNVEIARIAELVSEPMMGHIRLQWWRETVEGIDRGETRGHPVAEAMAASGLPRDRLVALIDAREQDLSEELFDDLHALEAYAQATSTTIMEIAATIIDVEVPAEVIRPASIAYSLTGLLRALPIHASQGRIMMPADLLRAYDVDPHSVLTGQMTGGLRAVILDVATRARTLLAETRQERVSGAALPVLLPTTICDRYLAMMTEPGFDPFRQSTEVPAFRRQLRLLRARLTGRI